MKQKLRGILEPSANDVLSGRGKGNEKHSGNIRYRAIIKRRQIEYNQLAKTRDKNIVAKMVFQEIQSLNPPGRFLTQTKDCHLWYHQDEESVMLKIKQALREKAKVVKQDQNSPAKTKMRATANTTTRGGKGSDTDQGKKMTPARTKKVYTCVDVPDTGGKPSKKDMEKLLDLCRNLS